MKHLLIILFTLSTFFAGAQINPNSITDAYQSVASAIKYSKSAGFKFDVIENGVISHFVTMDRSDGYLKPDSVMVIVMADTTKIIVRQAQSIQVEWFKKANEKDWYNAFQRLAKYASARPGTVINLNPVVYNIDTMKMGTPIFASEVVRKDSVVVDSNGVVTDTVTVSDTVWHVTKSFIPNNITDINWNDPQDLTINGNGAKINVRGNFKREWTYTNTAGWLHASAYNSVCPIQIMWGKNVTIRDLEIDGNVDQMTKDTLVNEGVDYGIIFRGTQVITVENCYTHHFATDGLYIEGAGPGANGPNGGKSGNPARFATVTGLRSLYNGRQALTIGGLVHGKFINCDLSHTADSVGKYGGHSPAKGVDIEPIYTYPGRTNEMTSDIEFIGCRFVSNVGGAFAASLTQTIKDVTIRGGIIDNAPFNPAFTIVAGIYNFLCEGVSINTGQSLMYATWATAGGKKATWRNNTIISGSTGLTALSGADYGITIENNTIIGKHDNTFNNYFPNINIGCIFRNNTIVLDSGLYNPNNTRRSGLVQKAILVEGNTWISQMDTSGGRVPYPISYASTKTIRGEKYTASQAVRPTGGWPGAGTNDYTFGEVGIGSKQIANVAGKIVATSYAATIPTTGLFNTGDIVHCTNPLSGIDHWRCMTGGDAALGTAVFSSVPISSTGATVYHNAIVATGSDIYVGRNIDSVGTSKLSHALLPPGGQYFSKLTNDTGMVVFKSPLAFTNSGEIIVKGTIYMRGKGNVNFTVSSLTLGNATFNNNNAIIQGDSSLAGTKVRWLKNSNNDVFLAFFDSTTTLTKQTVVHIESITLTASTQSYIDHATTAWTPMVLRSLSGYTATIVPNTGQAYITASHWDNNDMLTLTPGANAPNGLQIKTVKGANTDLMTFGSASDGRTIGVTTNGVAANLIFNANQVVYNSVLKIGTQKALAFANWDNSNTGYAVFQPEANGNFDFNVNGVNALVISPVSRALFAGPINPQIYTVATLPTSPFVRDICFVSDALNPVNGSTVVGGGTSVVPVYRNSTNWIVMGAGGFWTLSGNTISPSNAAYNFKVNAPVSSNSSDSVYVKDNTTGIMSVAPASRFSASARTLTVTATATLTLSYAIDYVYTGTGAADWTLPAINSNTGSANTIRIVNKSTNNLTIHSNGGASTIFGTSGGTATYILASGATTTLLPDGTSFDIMK